MARETSGGRIGRTVYMPEDSWTRLEALARGEEDHPAFRTWEIRYGSVSSVIERIVGWEAAQELLTMREQVDQAHRRLAEARDLKSVAGQVAIDLQRDLSKVVDMLIRIREADL